MIKSSGESVTIIQEDRPKTEKFNENYHCVKFHYFIIIAVAAAIRFSHEWNDVSNLKNE